MSEERRDVLEGLGSYTPGPWRGCGDHREGCRCRQVWSTPEDVMTAVAIMADDEDYTLGEGIASLDMARANTHLIARAPELVEEVKRLRTLARELYGALRTIRDRTEPGRTNAPDYDPQQTVADVWEDARQALHRAREEGIGGEGD